MKRFLLLFILISLNTNVLAEIKTFSVTVREVMGERESKDEVREIAALKARLQAQEQAGVYLEAENFFKQVAVETKDRLDMQDEHRKQIRAITAGVTSHKVTEERWEAESGQFVLYLTCEVTLDTGDVDRQIAELVKDRQKYDDMAKLQEMFAQQQTQIEELRVKLEEATSAQVKEVKEERKAASDALTAVDWFEKGQAAEDEDAKIAAFSRSIALDPNWVNPYRLRGMSYTAKKQFGEAQNDFNLALAIDPNDAKSYFVDRKSVV